MFIVNLIIGIIKLLLGLIKGILSFIGLVIKFLGSFIFAVPMWAVILELLLLIRGLKSTQKYSVLQSVGKNPRKTAGKFLWIFLLLLTTIAVILGFVGINTNCEPIDVDNFHKIFFRDKTYDNGEYPGIFPGMLKNYHKEIMLFAAGSFISALIILVLRSLANHRIYYGDDVFETQHIVQRIMYVLLPMIVSLIFSDFVAEHFINESFLSHLSSHRILLNFEAGADIILMRGFSIFVLLYLSTRICLKCWWDFSYIPKSCGGKLAFAILTFPIYVIVDYIVIRYLYIPLSLLIPMLKVGFELIIIATFLWGISIFIPDFGNGGVDEGVKSIDYMRYTRIRYSNDEREKREFHNSLSTTERLELHDEIKNSDPYLGSLEARRFDEDAKKYD